METPDLLDRVPHSSELSETAWEALQEGAISGSEAWRVSLMLEEGDLYLPECQVRALNLALCKVQLWQMEASGPLH